jgi:tRNA A-37 threonylcarbamoyl transferase component Bud32/tetratricopeptide (TPR) repeat protein
MPPLDHSLRSGSHEPRSQASTPSRIGRYRVERELGRGAFGVVYLAHSSHLDRQVALKVMLDPELADPEDRARFLLEARVAAKLHSPGIVKVHDLGEDAGRLFFVMDYCPGQTLSQALAAGPLPPREAARIVAELARSMTTAHSKGVLHRDLKPGNVILDAETGKPQITDFGLARDRSLLRSMTRTGDVLGTPLYMAPEQIRGAKGLDHRADLYALGAILYRCLTGEPPLQATNFYQLSQLIQRVVPTPPSQLRREVPRSLDAICLRALAKEPDERHPTCEDLADELEAYLEGRAVPGLGVSSSHRRGQVVLAVVALTLVAAAALVAVALLRAGRRSPLAAAQTPTAPQASPTEATPAPTTPESPLALLERAHRQRRDLEPYAAVAQTLAQAVSEAQRRQDSDLIAEARFAQAQLQLARGRFEEAWETAEALGHAEAALLACLARYAGGQRTRACWALLALSNEPSPARPLARAAAFTFLGFDVTSRGARHELRDLTAEAIDEALRAHPRHPLALALAGAGQLRRDPAQAEANWTLAVELAPDDALIAYIQARALDRIRRVMEWRGELGRLEELDRGMNRAWSSFLELTAGTRSFARATCLITRYEYLQERPSSIDDLREGLETRPDHVRAHFWLGGLLAKAGDLEAARIHWRRAWAYSPELERLFFFLVNGNDRDALAGYFRGGQRPPTLAEGLPAKLQVEWAAAIDFTPLAQAWTRRVTATEREALVPAIQASAQGVGWGVLQPLLEQAERALSSTEGALVLARLLNGRDAADWALRALDGEAAQPATPALELERADALRRAGRPKDAQAVLERLRSAEAPVGAAARAELAMLRDDRPLARQEAAQALEEDPDDVARAGLLALAWAADDPLRARGLAGDARARWGDLNARVLLALELAYSYGMAQGLHAWPHVYDKLLHARTAGASSVPSFVEGRLAVLQSPYRDGGELPATTWQRVEEFIERGPPLAGALAAKGRLARHFGKTNAAQRAFEEARALDPTLALPD